MIPSSGCSERRLEVSLVCLCIFLLQFGEGLFIGILGSNLWALGQGHCRVLRKCHGEEECGPKGQIFFLALERIRHSRRGNLIDRDTLECGNEGKFDMLFCIPLH